MPSPCTVAYFSMEIALDPRIPTYSGGLGVLAGDTVRSAADLRVPLVAVSLLHRKGYFRQRLGPGGEQREEPDEWEPGRLLLALPARASVVLEGRTVELCAWQFDVSGVDGFTVPVYLLDSDLPANAPWDRTLTHHLYGGDETYRLCQEAILGIGGLRMLRALGHDRLRRFHMNEGHSSLITLELLDEQLRRSRRTEPEADDLAAVRRQCVFTTHTPVPAGHDQFPLDLAARVLGRRNLYDRKDIFCCDGVLNMTYLALNLSAYVNGVARRHGEVSQHMFAGYRIDSITNGVHAATWTGPAFRDLYDRLIPGWRADNFSLRSALGIPAADVWEAHRTQKHRLLEHVHGATGRRLDENVLTIGFARRATAYKRGDLLFADLDRLRRIAAAGRLQVLYAGKAHPRDFDGKRQIGRVFEAAGALGDTIPVVYLEDYGIELGRLMTAGVDLWLNTPQPPLEASGTSGMKAALNGVPSLSIPDGWWIEGCIEGVTGWSIGEDGRTLASGARGQAPVRDDPRDAASLYDRLEHAVVPLFYGDRGGYVDVMRHAIALNGSFFNTQRMMQQYVLKAYFA